MADEIRYGVGFDPDRAGAERAADPLEDAITKAMGDAIKTFVAEFRRGISTVGKAFRDDPGMRRFQTNLHGITEELKDTANASSRFADSFSADLRALEARARATQAAIAKTGNQGGIGASIEVQLRKTLELQRDIERNSVELARNPALIRAYENRAEIIRSGLAQDVKFVNRILEQQTQNEIAELNQRNAAAQAASRERIAAVNADRSRNVVAQQREGALELEEARRTSRLKLQDERASARQRLAIIQAVSQQIRALERGISAGLRGIGSVLGGIAGGVSSATSRITGIFRRSDAQMNAGLQPALERRTSIFRRELRQTESIIAASTVRQSRLFQQAEVQASRGLAGVASGRSQAGALLGGGIAIGGTFALLTKLKQGFQESVNLNESLNKTRQIFGDATAEILAFADTSVEALFVTKSAALEAAANFGIFGKSAGLAGPELAGFSKTLTVLATDLASFNNTSISDATTAIAAALRGESEPIRKYGVLLNEAVLQNRALAEGITDTIRKLTPQERVLAANLEILAQTVVQQGDAARTANDFANSSRRAAAASTEFFASIAKFAVPFATILTNGILPVFITLTALVNNEVGPMLSILRDGLIGAGAALGGLLAAKAAGEALKFLALGLRAVLSPIGLLVTAVALVGAAVNILANRSPALDAALGRLRDTVGDLVRSGLGLAADLFRRLADVVIDRLLPAVTRLSLFLARNLQSAFRDAVEFVEDRVLPVLERFGRFVRDRVLPPLIEFAQLARDRIAQGLDIARGAAVEFFEAIRPFIAPLVEGFRNLGDAVRDALGGDFSGALERLRSFGTEAKIVAGAIGVGIALAFVNPLLGIGVAVAGLLGVAFGPRLLDALRPQAERFGRFLRDLFSIDNLSDVGVGFLKVVRRIGEIIGGIVTDRRFVTALAAIAAAIAATAGAALLGFADGVRANIPELIDLLGDALRLAFREAFKFALSNPEVMVGVIAGAVVLNAIRRAFAIAGAAGATSFGGSFVAGTRAFFQRNAFATGLFGGFAGLEAAASKQAQAEARALQKARVAAGRDLGLLGVPQTGAFVVGPTGADSTVRDSVAQLDAVKKKFGEAQVAGALFRAESDRAFRSLGVAAGGLGQALSGNVSGGLKQASAGLAGFATSTRQLFSRLRSDLKASAGGLGLALGGAIASGIGAALSGQILGTAEGGGGRALGLAGILSSALFASAATGGNAGVGVAVAAIGLVTAALSRNEKIASAARDRIAEYTQELRGLKTPGEQAAFAIDKISDRLLGLPAGALLLLQQAGINATDLGVAFANGTLDAKALEDQIRALPGAVPEGFEGTKLITSDAREAIDFLKSAITELQSAEARQPILDRVIGDPRSLDVVTSRVEGLNREIQKIRAGGGILQFQLGADTDEAQRNVLAIAERSETAELAVDNVTTAIDTLNQKRTDRINSEISKISDQLTDARDAAEIARDAITSFLTNDYQDTLFQQFDALVSQIPSVGQAVGDAVTQGGRIGDSALRSTFEGFESTIAGIIQQGVTDGIIVDRATAQLALGGLFEAITQGVNLDPEDTFDEAAGDRLRGILQAAIDNGDFEASVGLLNEAETEVARLQQELDRQTVKLNAEVVFSRAQIRKSLIDGLGLTEAEANRVLDFSIIRDRAASEGESVGLGTADGMERGILAGIPRVETAANLLATAVDIETRRALQSSSPSKVFEEIGSTIPEGLAQGIAASSPAAVAAALGLTSQLTGVLTGENFEDSFLSGLDSFIGRVGSLGDALGSALETGGEIGASAAREAFVGLDEQVRELLQRGIAEGSVFDGASAQAALGPLFRALSQGAALDPEDLFTDTVARQLQDRISSTLSGLDIGALSASSGLLVGESSAENPDSNTGRFAEQIRQLIQIFVNSRMAHPPGWIQTEDGSWVPPSFFSPPPSLGQGTPSSSVDMREGAVSSQPFSAMRIDNVNITEATSARATARETIMSLKTAALSGIPLATANRVPVDVAAG